MDSFKKFWNFLYGFGTKLIVCNILVLNFIRLEIWRCELEANIKTKYASFVTMFLIW